MALTIIEGIDRKVKSVVLGCLLTLPRNAVWFFNCHQLIISTVIPTYLLSVRHGWWILIQWEVYWHRFVLHWCCENRISVLLLLLHQLLLMLLDIDLWLVFDASTYSCVGRASTSDSIECASSDPSKKFGPRRYQRLLYVCVYLADHDSLVRIALYDAATHSTQTVLYRLQCTITLNTNISINIYHQKWETRSDQALKNFDYLPNERIGLREESFSCQGGSPATHQHPCSCYVVHAGEGRACYLGCPEEYEGFKEWTKLIDHSLKLCCLCFRWVPMSRLEHHLQ